MSLKDEVCSVEYAKRLKTLGVKQDSPLQWVEVPHKFSIDTNLTKQVTESKIQLVFGAYATIQDKINEWAAFTCGELFERLPASIDTGKDEPFNFFWLHVVKRSVKEIQYIVNYYCDTHKISPDNDPFFATNLVQERIYDERLADALAKMYIHVLEKGLVKL